EALERIVLRALEKNPEQRFSNARELARELRVLQGRSMPLDLRTGPLPGIPGRARPAAARRPLVRRAAFAAAAAVLGAVTVAYLWMIRPVQRIAVVVAPVVNQTGYAELDPYRLALTETLIDELAASPNVRVLSYDRVLQMVRRFLST